MTAVSTSLSLFSPTRWTPSAITVLKERYLKKDEQGNVIETPEEMCWRVAAGIAKAEGLYPKPFGYHGTNPVEYWTEKFYNIMLDGDFLPNSPCLMNAGKNNGLALSACYVLNVPDSLEGIMDTAKSQALIQKSGGGTGFSFSQLRPRDAWIRGTYGKSSGPISFLHIFNEVTDKVKQGMMRRGANMGVLRVDSGDILEFITAKRPTGVLRLSNGDEVVQYPLTNFNLSVGLTGAFMKALENGTDYDLIDPHTNAVIRSQNAQEVWDLIGQCAWETGDPGLVFIDRVNESRANPIPELEQIEATNPCGEQPLLDNDVCNLGSINLGKFIHRRSVMTYTSGFNGKPSPEMIIEPYYSFDWERFKDVVRTSIRFLDNVIDMNPYPLPAIDKKAKEIRRVGLGVMGWADALVLLGLEYDSHAANELGKEIMKVMNETAIEASEDLALERGAFPLQPFSRYKNDKPRRNSNLTTVAPTGTISLIDNCSSGIEPYFAIAYQHRVAQPDGTTRILNIAAEPFEYIAKREGFYSEELIAYVAENGTVQGRSDVPEKWQRVFKVAQEIKPIDHIIMQAAWQRYNDSGISKTINLPSDATAEEIKFYYQMAYDMGCMGVTVYRDGCKQFQVLNVGKKKETTLTITETVEEEILVTRVDTKHRQGTEECPSCGEMTLIHESGCDKCINLSCNYSHCTV